MTHVAAATAIDRTLDADRSVALRSKILRSFAGVAILAAIGGGAVALPLASPATVVAPANCGISLAVTRQARAAWFQSMFAQGYELVPASSQIGS